MIRGSAISGVNISVSKPKYIWLLNSPQEALAIYKNRINSLFPLRSNPSAMLEDMERAERRAWSRKKKELQFFSASNASRFNSLDSFHTISSSNLSTLDFIKDSPIYWIKLNNLFNSSISISGNSTSSTFSASSTFHLIAPSL